MRIAIIAEYDASFAPHRQTNQAMVDSASDLGVSVSSEWLSTADLRLAELSEFDGLWFAPGSPYKNLLQTLLALRYARLQNIPTLGTCGGFQHMVIEFARHVVGLEDAQHAEYDPYASRLIVSRLDCSLMGKEMAIALRPGSRIQAAYGCESTVERYYCNFGVDPDYVNALSEAGLEVVASDSAGECRAMEIPELRFYVGTLFVPQARSTRQQPHPLVNAFLQAAGAERAGS